MADGPLHLIDHRADNVQRGSPRRVLVTALHKRNLRARHDQRDRHKESILIQAEIHSVHINRHICSRQVAGQLFLKLALAVLMAGMLEVCRRVVAGPVLKLHSRPVDLDGQLAIAAVAQRIGAAESDGVVSRSVALDLGKGRRKIVGVEERLAARVGRERRHHLLRSKVRVHVIHQRAAAVGAAATQAAGGGIAQRRNRLQAARVHAVDGQVGAHRGVDRSSQRSLILDPIARDSAGKIKQRLLLRDFFERLRNRSQRKQLAIRVQVVVFALVRRVPGGILRLVRVRGGALRETLSLGPVVDGHFVDQRLLVGGKILVYLERVAERNQRHQVGRLHFVLQKFLRREHAAIQVFGLHRGQIEKHHNQPVIAQFLGLRHHHGLRSVAPRPRGQPNHRGLIQRRGLVNTFKVERLNLLLLAVFVDAEIAFLQPLHHLAGLRIPRHHIGQHQFAVHLQDEAALRRVRDLSARCIAGALCKRRLCARQSHCQRR